MQNIDPADVIGIYQTKSRYFRYLDTKEWAKLRDLFTDDLVFQEDSPTLPTDANPPVTDADTFVEWVSDLLKTAVTVHHGHMPKIEFTSPAEATAVFAMSDFVDDPVNRKAAHQGYGHYHETFRKGDDDVWRIATMRLSRLRVDKREPSTPSVQRTFPEPWHRPAK
jgi:hypothetical protein